MVASDVAGHRFTVYPVVTATSIKVKVPAGLLAQNVTSRRVAITVSTAGGTATSDDTFTVVAAVSGARA